MSWGHVYYFEMTCLLMHCFTNVKSFHSSYLVVKLVVFLKLITWQTSDVETMNVTLDYITGKDVTNWCTVSYDIYIYEMTEAYL